MTNLPTLEQKQSILYYSKKITDKGIDNLMIENKKQYLPSSAKNFRTKNVQGIIVSNLLSRIYQVDI